MGMKTNDWATIKTKTSKNISGLVFGRMKEGHVHEDISKHIKQSINPAIVATPVLNVYPKNCSAFFALGAARLATKLKQQPTRIYFLASTIWGRALWSYGERSAASTTKWGNYTKAHGDGHSKSKEDWKAYLKENSNEIMTDETLDIIAATMRAAYGPFRKSNELLNGEAWFTSPTNAEWKPLFNFKLPFAQFDEYGFAACDGLRYPLGPTSPLSFGIGHHKYV